MTPGLACMIRHPSCAIRRRVCGLLSSPICPGSPGIRVGARLQAGLSAGPHCGVVAASPSDAVPMPPRGFEQVGWRLICGGVTQVLDVCLTGLVGNLLRRTLVSSETCPDFDMPVRMSDSARALECVRMPVKMRA